MTADQDMPNTEAQAKAELWKAMGYPRWDLLPVEHMEKESMCLRIIKLFRVFSWRKDRLQ